MSSEVWLSGNLRAQRILLVPAAVAVVAAGIWLAWAWSTPQRGWSLGAFVVALVWLGERLRRVNRPRLSYRDGRLLVHLYRGRRAEAVPIEVVECFFLGQGPSLLPKPLETSAGGGNEARTIVVRLAEAAKEWHHRDVRASLGQWCEGYIILRGTWTEPLTAELAKSLNHRLVQAHRSVRQAAQTTVSA